MTEPYELIMTVGSSLHRIFRFKDAAEDPYDLTDYKANIHIRKCLSCKEIFISLNSDTPTTYGSYLDIDEALGEVELYIHPKETDRLINITEDQIFKWDLRLIDDDDKITIYFPSSDFIIKPISTRIKVD